MRSGAAMFNLQHEQRSSRLYAIARQLRPVEAATTAEKPTVAVFYGLGGGDKLALTDLPGPQVMDAMDPHIREYLGDKCELLNYEEAMARSGGVDAVRAILSFSHTD